MRIAVLGDVHANLEALTAVVDAVLRERVDRWVQVGDVVGYGADPEVCVDRIRELGCDVCMGNHDAAVVGLLSVHGFNQFARAAIEWTQEHLRPDQLDYLRNLPSVLHGETYSVTHGSFDTPSEFGYVFSRVEAADSLSHQMTRVGFVGHSHEPVLYMRTNGPHPHDLREIRSPEFEADISHARAVLLNVGSVGQPRDEDPRAAYAIYDSEANTVRIARVKYDIRTAQDKIRRAGLPPVLAERLALGV